MSEPKKPTPKQSGKPGAPKQGEWPGQPGGEPGDEWGEDNPGNVHAIGVDDHVFFHRDGAGPHAGRVVAHGVHGCTVEDASKVRHKVRWPRVLGVKAKAVLPAKVVDQGAGGSILEHPDGRRIFVAGELPIEDRQARLSDIAGLEDAGRKPKTAKLSDLEEFARGGRDDLSKADHPCEGPALCRVCAQRDLVGSDLGKSFAPEVDALAERARRLRRGSSLALKSLGAGARPLPVLLRRPG